MEPEIKTPEMSVEEAFEKLTSKVEEPEVEVSDEKVTEESPKEEATPEATKPETPAPEDVFVEPPASLSGQIKAKWKELPSDVRAEWAKREADIHKMVTRHDGELQVGREMKEVITPYMAMIQSEGLTPSSVVKEMLNTAYVLRTGSPHQKASFLKQVADNFGVDLSLAASQTEEQHPSITVLQREIEQLRQQANPEYIKSQLTQQMEQDRIKSEVETFASDPAHQYYEQVKPLMASLLGTGAATSLKEAYDLACKAHPAISSTLIAQEAAKLQAKKTESLDAKRKAAVSPAGSSGVTTPNTTAAKSPEDAVRLAFETLANRNI